ncbi:MAG: DUF2779 domain-containing protein [Chloroflexi bacterium]|nr:DUF2779 domain-containing protein [Chloroflexota bacterium]
MDAGTLTKSDYLLYRQAPLHLWARAHGRLSDAPPSAQDLHRMRQGLAIEPAARAFLEARLAGQAVLNWQPTFSDGPYEFRADVLARDEASGDVDLYEIKAVTRLDASHIEDTAFQALVLRTHHPLRRATIVHLNREYVRGAELKPAGLFIAEDVTAQIEVVEPLVLAERARAHALLAEAAAAPLEAHCTNPNTCPCPEVCHPGLPELSIYDIPRLNAGKAAELRERGVLDLRDVPGDFPLTDRQRRMVLATQTGAPLIDVERIRSTLAGLAWPLWFLDYETFDPSLPWFKGYRPYQDMVFQFSLHVLTEPGADPQHFEHLALGPDDPGRSVAAALAAVMQPTGAVLVWNKGFEAARNKEMASLYPEYAETLLSINDRLFDLMTVFGQGHYIHPGFKGSASIKSVLPVLLPQFSYADLPVGEGSQAMQVWEELVRGARQGEARREAIQDLLAYCRLDTLAMLEIWRFLSLL